MKIGFLVGDIANISGGSNVILEYATRLQDHGHEVVLLTPGPVQLTHPLWHPGLARLSLRPLAEAEGETFDFALATWWLTFYELWRVDARVYGYLNQSLESRFHAEPHHKLLNRHTYALPLLFLTEARWLVEFIQTAQPQGRVLYVQKGLSREHFPRAEAPAERTGPLRVLVEGPWGVGFKGVPETFEVLRAARAAGVVFDTGWLTSTSGGVRPQVGDQRVEPIERLPIQQVHSVLRQYDVMLKLSRVEGMFGPPLEMFSQGGTAITYTVTGNDEYMVHGHNALLVEPHNRRQILQYLRLLSTQPAYLAHLRRNALDTARAFPDWDASTLQLLAGLEQVRAEGWNNAHLRPALAALASLRGCWLEDVRQYEDTLTQSYVGPGEKTLLERYRRLKGSRPVRALKALVPTGLKRSLRARLSGSTP